MVRAGGRRAAGGAVVLATVLGLPLLPADGLIGRAAADPPGCSWSLLRPASLPDLQTVVPKHLALKREHGREVLRFTNGIANRGKGPLRLVPRPTPAGTTEAVQELVGPAGEVVCALAVSEFEFHPAHNHWHVGDVALFEVRVARDDGRGGRYGATAKNDAGAAQSLKVSFCLVDWYRLDDNSPTPERVYWDCTAASPQGISPGWVDQYHHALEGQELDVTGLPEGVYYLVSTANPDGTLIEAEPANNTAWVSFWLLRDRQGRPTLAEIAHSPCETPGMCGEQATNR